VALAEVLSAPPVAVTARAGSRSSREQRAAMRALAGAGWWHHAEAVAAALDALPALSDADREAAETDLTALRLYLDDADGALDHRELARALRAGENHLAPYAACLASGLRLLPAYRGVVLRGAGGELDEEDELRPGTLLRDPAPVSAMTATGRTALPRGPRYAIWSVTGRQTWGPSADGGKPEAGAQQEVVFAPGTPFRVLDVRTGGASTVILLRELPPSGGPFTTGSGQETVELDDADRLACARLNEALKARSGPPGTVGWPTRCAGPVGHGP
jgi:hypothetical protein